MIKIIEQENTMYVCLSLQKENYQDPGLFQPFYNEWTRVSF
jgi:hypothetical protein